MYPPLMLSVIFFSKSSPSEGERIKAMSRERKTARLLRSKHHGVVG